MSPSDENKDAAAPKKTDKVYQEYFNAITGLPTETVLEQIRQGKDPITNAVTNFTSPEQKAYRNRLVEGGLVSIVLGLLTRCEGETLADVIGEQGDVESYVNSPGVWPSLLANAMSSEDQSKYGRGCPHCMEIAESVGPLIKCMRDDKTRMFFQSNKEWAFSYPFSLGLFANVALMNPQTLDVLLQYDGFLEMIIQCLFWEEERPDIMGDEHVQSSFLPRIALAKFAARRILYLVCAKIGGMTGPGLQQGGRGVHEMTAEEKKQLYNIGVTPIVSEAYDPNCTVPFVAGLLDLVKSSDESGKRTWYFILGELASSECVDASVIKSVVDLGSNANDPFDAEQLPRLLYRMLNIAVPGVKKQFRPVDVRYGVAIEAGLFQMCFKLLVRFGDVQGVEICNVFHSILKGATALVFHPNTSKAIANVRIQTRAECQNPELQRLKDNAKCSNVLEMLSFFAKDLESGFPAGGNRANEAVVCRSCSKALEKDAIKRCSRCKKATYCSRECQASDWKEHKRECKAREVEHSGLSERDQGKAEKQIQKVVNASSVMLAERTGYLLKWCIVNNHDVLDCIAIMDYRTAPPSFEVQTAADFFRTNGSQMRLGEHLHSGAKERVAQNRSQGSFTAIIKLFPSAEAGNANTATLIQECPSEKFAGGSWQAMQKGVKESMVQEGWSDGHPYPLD